MVSFQEIIFRLSSFWAQHHCVILQPYDLEVGAGTSHPFTLLYALGSKPWRAAFVQPSRRPSDGRYGSNPNRLQKYYQFQVILKPAPHNMQELLLESYQTLGLNLAHNDIRFVEDDWENPSLGASGVGWEVWLNGMEITQVTYFQQVGSIQCEVTPLEITYGLERIAMCVQKKSNVFDIVWNDAKAPFQHTYGDLFKENEKQFSQWHFEQSHSHQLEYFFDAALKNGQELLESGLELPAYEQALKASHIFNMLEARGGVSVAQRALAIQRIRHLVHKCCEKWLNFFQNTHDASSKN
jgi:glycyl-tRNA synthetase alpha chain